jgi:hypothetical protein
MELRNYRQEQSRDQSYHQSIGRHYPAISLTGENLWENESIVEIGREAGSVPEAHSKSQKIEDTCKYAQELDSTER